MVMWWRVQVWEQITPEEEAEKMTVPYKHGRMLIVPPPPPAHHRHPP